MLVRLQETHWKPLISWAKKAFDVDILVFDSLLGATQPAATKDAFSRVLRDFGPWQLAGKYYKPVLMHMRCADRLL